MVADGGEWLTNRDWARRKRRRIFGFYSRTAVLGKRTLTLSGVKAFSVSRFNHASCGDLLVCCIGGC